MTMIPTYHPGLVLLAVAVGVLGSVTALTLTSRSYARTSDWRHTLAVANGGLMMGLTIWSMHFVAMMAVDLPLPITYDLEQTLRSVGIAIVATGTGLYLASSNRLGVASIPVGGVLMGLGIAGMHYTGMDAIRGCALGYDARLVAASIVIAILASMVALWLACMKRDLLTTLAGGVIQGLAIGAMHFTAMWATSFLPVDINPEDLLAPLMPQGVLAVAIAVGVLVMSITNLTFVHILSMQRHRPG